MGKFGTALEFDGAGSRIVVAADDALRNRGKYYPHGVVQSKRSTHQPRRE